MPAGKYIVRFVTERQMLIFHNVATGHSSLMLVYPHKSGTLEKPILTFRHNGERYTLESAWFAGVQGGYGPLGGTRVDRERGILATVRLLQE